MKISILLSLFFSLIACSHMTKADNRDPEVIQSLDIKRYMGLWYEIARSPNFFQRDCIRSTAEYGLNSDSTVSVLNTCYKEDGEISDIKGTARVPNPEEPAKLKVKFNFFARGDYWIIDLDPNYQWAIVSAPGKKNLFILSRQAPMDKALLDQILSSLKEKGFETDRFIFDRY